MVSPLNGVAIESWQPAAVIQTEPAPAWRASTLAGFSYTAPADAGKTTGYREGTGRFDGHGWC
jgi:hypothetical protein